MVGKQAQAFLLGEGDKWHERNKDKPRGSDPVLEAIRSCNLQPTRILEVGCNDGRRLEALSNEYGAPCDGIEPSATALGTDNHSFWNPIHKGKICLYRGTAGGITGHHLYDLIIFAFCLYLVDREDLFEIVTRADRALTNGGHIIIHDFFAWAPSARVYKHAPELKSYRMNHPNLWLAHPHYQLFSQAVIGVPGELPWEDGVTAVSVLRKKTEGAFPCA